MNEQFSIFFVTCNVIVKSMAKYIFTLLVLFTCFQLDLKAQDLLYTTDGKLIEVTIEEIRDQEIAYKNYANPNGPTYIIQKSSIHKIVFESGIEETFNQSGNQIDLSSQDFNSGNNTIRIYTTDGKMIECESIEKKRFGFNYIPLQGGTSYALYLPNSKIDRIVFADGEVEYVSGTPGNQKRNRSPKDFSYLSPHYLSLTFGPSFPFGVFGSSQGSSSGYASTGFDVNLDATYYLFRGLGFSATLGYTMNPFDDVALRSFVLSAVPPDATDIRVNIDEWHNLYFLGGIGYYNDFGRLMLDYKAIGGMLYTVYPTSVVAYNKDGNEFRSEYKDQSVSFIFGGYSGFRYYITRKWAVKGGLTMLFGKAVFQGLNKRDYTNGTLQSQTIVGSGFEQPIAWIMINAGISYTLGK